MTVSSVGAAVGPEETSTGKAAGGDDSFFDTWLEESGAKTESRVATVLQKSVTTKASSSKNSKVISVSEEQHLASESKLGASEKLGLTRSKERVRSSKGDNEKGVEHSLQEHNSDVLTKKNALREETDLPVKKTEVSDISEAETCSVAESSTCQKETDEVTKEQSVQDTENTKENLSAPGVPDEKERNELKEGATQPSDTQDVSSDLGLEAPVGEEVAVEKEREPVTPESSAEKCLRKSSCQEHTEEIESEPVEDAVREEIPTKAATFDDSCSATEGQTWSEELGEVDLTLVDTARDNSGECEEKTEQVETKTDSQQIEQTETVTEENKSDDSPEAEKTTDHTVEEESDRKNVTEADAAKNQVQDTETAETNSKVQETSAAATEEQMGDSLSDSRSEGSVVEKPPPMQVSSESGTTTSDEVDEYNKTLTEEDFKKLGPVDGQAEKTNDQSSGNKPDNKPSPEHGAGSGSSGLTTSGYVKSMIEEAMVESLKESDSHSDRSSDKSSDMVRIGSGMNSGHTSGDEIDTTTSSDIEIISTPTPNGEFRPTERPFDLSPLRHALSKTVRRGGSPPGHRRSDSGSSAQSNWSKNGDDLLSPEGAANRHAEVTSHTHGKTRIFIFVSEAKNI